MIKIKLKDWKTFYAGQLLALPDKLALALVKANAADLIEPQRAVEPEYETRGRGSSRKQGKSNASANVVN